MHTMKAVEQKQKGPSGCPLAGCDNTVHSVPLMHTVILMVERTCSLSLPKEEETLCFLLASHLHDCLGGVHRHQDDPERCSSSRSHHSLEPDVQVGSHFIAFQQREGASIGCGVSKSAQGSLRDNKAFVDEMHMHWSTSARQDTYIWHQCTMAKCICSLPEMSHQHNAYVRTKICISAVLHWLQCLRVCPKVPALLECSVPVHR